MAILNRTPNSGLDPASTLDLDDVVRRAEEAISDGAEWIDVGGRSFRADQPPLSDQEEIERVVPVIRAVRDKTDAVISVDTHLPAVARAALEAGADVVNDTNALRTPGMVEIVAGSGASVIITHSVGGPHHHVPRPTYGDVVKEVAEFLRERVEYAQAHGVPPERIFIDPGHDLNKNSADSLELTRRLDEITVLGYPCMVAVSNKHFIRETLNALRGVSLLEGTIAVNTMSVYQGARLVRVHDVAANVQAMRAAEVLVGLRELEHPQHNM
ncbi:dihydropteroate synthase [Spongiactinospora rosea]|uniref:dihydropteroate synthase n=1 Tax=Spongiactinospora rosea TaxID=2248750 RepID=A0A366LJH8_9ACTN|nr:dihydropteroate synthase [Spongiactinospora rosea]RBQ14048.1 dihydropteroate synthase [Spongiactinospora rosea]